MNTDIKRIKGIKTLFSIHLIVAYVISALIWASFGGGPYGVDVTYYKYAGFIHLIKDRFLDLIFIMGVIATLSAWRGIKRVQETVNNGKSSVWIVLDTVVISAIMINAIGIGAYIFHRSEFKTAGIDVFLTVHIIYTFIGLVIGAIIGPVLAIINFIWIKLLCD